MPIRFSRITLPFLTFTFCAGLALAHNAPPASPPAKKPAETSPQVTAPTSSGPVDPHWLEDIREVDRSLLNELVGYAPPAFTPNLQWVGSDAATWNSLRGKVVFIQSWTSANDLGRRALTRAQAVIEKLKSDDVKLIALHTPENADKAAAFIERKPIQNAIALIDPTGEFCDALSIYKTPVNILIDRQGAVRYVGLNTLGMNKAIEQLIDQPYDPNMMPAQRPADLPAAASADFPKITGTVSHGKDIRGKAAPAFAVDEWKTAKPDLKGKVVVIDFWATWCGPCKMAIPHMNSIQEKFSDDVVCIGISDESDSDFEIGMDKSHLKVNRDFKYAVALDPKHRMYGPIRIDAIPHCIIMSSDWIVRWQGNPLSLDEAVVRKIVDANRALNPADAPKTSPHGRWAQSTTH